jgi:hypothetical protein
MLVSTTFLSTFCKMLQHFFGNVGQNFSPFLGSFNRNVSTFLHELFFVNIFLENVGFLFFSTGSAARVNAGRRGGARTRGWLSGAQAWNPGGGARRSVGAGRARRPPAMAGGVRGVRGRDDGARVHDVGLVGCYWAL